MGGTLRVNIANIDQTERKATYDKTWQEVHDALESGMDVTYQYPSGMYFRIFGASSLPNLGYSILSEMLKSEDYSTPTLVVDGTFFTLLSSPDDYLIAQGSSGGGSDIDPTIETTN